MTAPARFLSRDDIDRARPVHAVWELTLACDLKCNHCGSRAGARRPDELTTEECVEVVAALARLGTREVTLIGGEAYLRPDWVRIIEAIVDAGMMCTLQTGGRSMTESRVRRAAEAGLSAAGVSIDGLRDLHDELRGVAGSYDRALETLARFRAHGVTTSVNTQISALVIPELRDLLGVVAGAGARNWQVQLTVAMGRAADHPEYLLQPYRLAEVMPLLAELYHEGNRHGVLMQAGNNVGFFGPYEHLLRGGGDRVVHYAGCPAGRTGIGIESNGIIKGCPSLPTTSYSGGNVRDVTLEEIWQGAEELSYARRRRRDELWGFCDTCYYADVCEAGCVWTSHSLLGRRGNNPYCHHRVLELERRGLRERIVQAEAAPGCSFDHGRYDLVLETLDGDLVEVITAPPLAAGGDGPVNLGLPTRARSSQPTRPDVPPPGHLFLDQCRACDRHVYEGTRECPHCGADVTAVRAEYDTRLAAAQGAADRLVALLS